MSTSNYNNSQKANINKKHSKVRIHLLKLHKTIKNNPINNQEQSKITGSDARTVTTIHGYLCSNQKWPNKIYRNSQQPIAISNNQRNNQYQSKRLKQSILITAAIFCFFFTFSMKHVEQYSELFLSFSNKDKSFVSTLLKKVFIGCLHSVIIIGFLCLDVIRFLFYLDLYGLLLVISFVITDHRAWL